MIFIKIEYKTFIINVGLMHLYKAGFFIFYLEGRKCISNNHISVSEIFKLSKILPIIVWISWDDWILFVIGSTKGYSQQSRDINMSLVLISTVAMFFFCHTPRLVVVLLIIIHITSLLLYLLNNFSRLFVSLHEAINIQSILHCRDKGDEIFQTIEIFYLLY